MAECRHGGPPVLTLKVGHSPAHATIVRLRLRDGSASAYCAECLAARRWRALAFRMLLWMAGASEEARYAAPWAEKGTA